VYTGFWWGNLRERVHLEDPGLDGSSGSGMGGMDCTGSGYRQVVGTCKYSNKPLGCVKCGEFLD